MHNDKEFNAIVWPTRFAAGNTLFLYCHFFLWGTTADFCQGETCVLAEGRTRLLRSLFLAQKEKKKKHWDPQNISIEVL